jgi:hypothetical protein
MVQMTLFGRALPDLHPPPVPKRRAPMQAAANDTANDTDLNMNPQAAAASGSLPLPKGEEDAARPASGSLPLPTGEEDAAQPGTDSGGGCSSGIQTHPASGKLPPVNAEEAEAPPAKLAQRSEADEATYPAFEELANIFNTAGVMEPIMPLGTPTCKRCNMMVDTVKPGTRLIRKTPPVWQCGSCCSKHVMLTRIFGTFPLPDFAALTSEEQTAFWKDAPTDVQGLKQAITETLTNSLVERTETGTAGQYLPLDVYAKQGFDTTHVEKGCHMKLHPVLGKVFRLDIDSVAWTKVREKCRRQVLEMISRKSNPLSPTPDRKPNKIEDDTSDSNDSDKKNNNSKKDKKDKNSKKDKHSKKDKKKHSKKDKKKHSKKDKHSKKGKKGGSSKKKKSSSSDSATSQSSSSDGNAKKRQMDAEKEEKKLQKKVQSDATKVLAKVRPLINNMSELMRQYNVDDMPKTILKKMQTELEILNNFEKEAREKIGGTATSMTFNMDDVAKASKALCDSMATVKSMMKQAAKLF